MANGKLEPSYRIPERFRSNTPARLERTLKAFRARGLFPTFPFGTDLTAEEQVLGRILKALKARMARRMGVAGVVKDVVSPSGGIPAAGRPYLARLGLEHPASLRETLLQRVVLAELRQGGYI